MLNDDHLLMTFEGTAVLENGARRPIEYDVTAGAVRQYRANPCQCENCLRIFPLAMQLLASQEDLLAGRIYRETARAQAEAMGYVRGENSTSLTAALGEGKSWMTSHG